jgi:hypothetical protein
MTNAIRTLSLAGAILSVAATANAQGTAEQTSACIRDAFRFCSAYIPNAARIEACLESNKRQLSPACRAQFEEPEKKPPFARSSYEVDRPRSVTPGPFWPSHRLSHTSDAWQTRMRITFKKPEHARRLRS